MTFAAPQVLLLAIPFALALGVWGRVSSRPAMALRIALVVVLVLALARPRLVLEQGGSDVVVVVDRSRSMPPGSETTAEELIRLAATQRGPGDRLGVIGFGREARVELPLSAESGFGGFTAAVDPEASSLSAGLEAALDVLPAERVGRVVVISDGKSTGPDPRGAARRLVARGVPVDVRYVGREDAALDVAVTELAAPASVEAREPFLLTATVKATADTTATFTLARGGTIISRTTRAVPAGATVISFRDLVEAPGLVPYEVRAEVAGDTVPENDVGRAVVRVEGPTRILVLTDRPEGALARALSSSRSTVDVRPPMPLTLDALDGVGAVVLEDVEAGRLSESGLHVLAQYVEQAGGGLVMTGGRRSFGEGGYRRSPVEDVLPVSLEIREEQRKAAVAISIIMDSSCSMGAQVPDGRTKMELAAEGVVGALQLLDSRDEASVHMVDTEPHQIFPMSPVSSGLPLGKVAGGFSGGGGIYVGVGLNTAREQILSTDKATRHVLLFSDAADSEEPGTYQATVADLVRQGVTVSVIGMGAPTDVDADLLRDVARRGNGRVYFAEDVLGLPRIFSQETIAVARSAFVDVPTTTSLGPDWTVLGSFPTARPPRIGGYNLTYLRPQASLGLRTEDDTAAPVVAMWPRGAGRAAVLTAEVDGEHTGDFRRWEGQRALLEQLVRWVMPPGGAGQGSAVARASLEGNDLHVTLDLDLEAAPLAGTPTVVLLSGDARARPVELPMRWEDEDRLGVHWPVPGSGTWHPVVKVDGRLYRAPPVTLPFAPEFDPLPAAEGKARLAQLALAGGGVQRLSMVGLFDDAADSRTGVPLAPALTALAVLLLVAEVFTRRFLAGPERIRRVRVARGVGRAGEGAGAAAAMATRAAEGTSVGAPSPSAAAVPSAVAASRPGEVAAPGEPAPDGGAPPSPRPSSLGDALKAARARAGKRTGK